MTTGTSRRWAPDRRLSIFLIVVFLFSPWCQSQADPGTSSSIDSSEASRKLWQTVISQADALGLPTAFIKAISPDFVTVEFDDLHAYAAEYHPDEHRMVLNQTLSFNAAGGVLKSLASLTSRDLGTLYHELFHAYMDYISVIPTPSEIGSEATRLLAFAKDRQECRYTQVAITPILQRKSHTETRVLTDRESWEALNETWAVFVGWAVWTLLEERGARPKKREKTRIGGERWLKRLEKANRDADLIGYYEPEDTAERAIARKRYLAPSHRISSAEVSILLQEILEFPKELSVRSAAVMEHNRPSLSDVSSCRK
ncbi:MAG: hypothetical protein ACREJU_03530 [Nitrospiraceae bacterium]